MSQDLQNSKIILTFFVFVLFISFIPSNIFGLEECPKNNLKARLNYDSGVFWAGRGKYQKAYDLLSNSLEICPNYSDAIEKHKEVELKLKKQKEVETIEKARRLNEQREAQEIAEERRRYEAHLQSEKERVFKEAREREKKEQEKKDSLAREKRIREAKQREESNPKFSRKGDIEQVTIKTYSKNECFRELNGAILEASSWGMRCVTMEKKGDLKAVMCSSDQFISLFTCDINHILTMETGRTEDLVNLLK